MRYRSERHWGAPMTRSPDGAAGDPANRDQRQADGGNLDGHNIGKDFRPARVLVVDADAALLGLLREWLGAYGHRILETCAVDAAAPQPVDLVAVDVPFPRQGGADVLRRVANYYPGTPVLALSSSFFPGIASDGAVARALGVASVLPIPVARDALIAAVHGLLRVKA